MKRKRAFKVGDKVRIARFPMRMVSGNDLKIKQQFDNRDILTIKRLELGSEHYIDGNGNRKQIPCCRIYEDSWYYDLSSLEHVPAKELRRPKSWSLNCVK